MIIKEVQRPPTWVRMSALGGGEQVDPIKTADLMLENAMRPKLEEPAIVHPFNTSVLKIRNNGMIDMFVGTDQGIRIDPYSKTINEIVDGLKWHVGYFKGWVEQDAKWYANGEILFKSEQSSINLDAKSNISAKAGQNVTITAGQDVTISCSGTLTLSAGAGVNINTQGGFNLNGSAFDLASSGPVTMGGSTVSIGSGSKSKAKLAETRDGESDGGCSCTGGVISGGSSSVFIDGLPAARQGDEVTIS